MTADNRTNEGVSAKAECTPHHWVSHHQDGLPVRWIEQCSLCGSFNAESLREQIYRSGEQFTDAMVEAAAKAIADCHNPGMFDRYPENWRVEARAALVAAQGAAPVLPSSGVDEDKLAEVIARASVVYSPMLDEEAQNLARAVAEWLKVQGGESRGDRQAG